jgi:hypothetical protein
MNEILASLMMLFAPVNDVSEPQIAEENVASTFAAQEKPPLGPDGIIPPNCTINPWTGKWTCHKWPKAPTTTK